MLEDVLHDEPLARFAVEPDRRHVERPDEEHREQRGEQPEIARPHLAPPRRAYQTGTTNRLSRAKKRTYAGSSFMYPTA